MGFEVIGLRISRGDPLGASPHIHPDWLQATTYSPPFTPPMDAAWGPIDPSITGTSKYQFFRNVVRKSREAGVDVDGWANAYMLGCVAGPAAEAHYLRSDPWKCLMSDENKHDWHGAFLAYGALHDLDGMEGHEREFVTANVAAMCSSDRDGRYVQARDHGARFEFSEARQYFWKPTPSFTLSRVDDQPRSGGAILWSTDM